MYPATSVYIGVVEGFPSLDYVVGGLVKDGIKKVMLKPLMIVAGDHATNDMAGDEDDSWKTAIKAKGIKVVTEVQGLGENPEVSKIFIQHIKDAAQDNQIDL
jgi:sirohydrochlorin cobaltochelatase